LWGDNLDGSECFAWMSLRDKPEWNSVMKSLDYIKAKVGNGVSNKIDGKLKFMERLRNYPGKLTRSRASHTHSNLIKYAIFKREFI